EEESTNFYHPGFGIKVALRNYAPVPHLLPILRHLRGNLFSFYRGKIRQTFQFSVFDFRFLCVLFAHLPSWHIKTH
ncbi:MAG: hypothetical protein IJM58_06435, partial [Muribaculaceae bacterium]|nr:hypothetical protein [Muribaculaceae bacterium]